MNDALLSSPLSDISLKSTGPKKASLRLVSESFEDMADFDREELIKATLHDEIVQFREVDVEVYSDGHWYEKRLQRESSKL
jgi:acid stress-induced BolA-like protein IbaG/YrbA